MPGNSVTQPYFLPGKFNLTALRAKFSENIQQITLIFILITRFDMRFQFTLSIYMYANEAKKKQWRRQKFLLKLLLANQLQYLVSPALHFNAVIWSGTKVTSVMRKKSFRAETKNVLEGSQKMCN